MPKAKMGRPKVGTTDAEILRLYAIGLSYRVIAAQLGISHQTVKNRLREHDKRNQTLKELRISLKKTKK